METRGCWKTILARALREMAQELGWHHPLRFCLVLMGYAIFSFFIIQFQTWSQIFNQIHSYVWFFISLFFALLPVYFLSVVITIPKVITEKDSIIADHQQQISSLEARLTSRPDEFVKGLLPEWEALKAGQYIGLRRVVEGVHKKLTQGPREDRAKDEDISARADFTRNCLRSWLLGDKELTEKTIARLQDYCTSEAVQLFKKAQTIEQKTNAYRAICNAIPDSLKPEIRMNLRPPKL